ncbi:MAG: c-type cytochrome [Pseudomonadota bacterium]|nr:c-type cytochrome [Pseudomonadota bacterium]
MTGAALAQTAALDQLKQTQADSSLTDAALKTGARVTTLCASCHGASGNSVQPDTPNLAGQNPRYMLVQMRRFEEGQRQNEFMQRLIKAMSIDERIGAALHFSRQFVTTRPPADAALVAQGKSYYERVCFRCHGGDGHGTESYARLAGQQIPYVTMVLKRYRDSTDSRIDPVMASNAKLMSDHDIEAVAAYVASMP